MALQNIPLLSLLSLKKLSTLGGVIRLINIILFANLYLNLFFHINLQQTVNGHFSNGFYATQLVLLLISYIFFSTLIFFSFQFVCVFLVGALKDLVYRYFSLDSDVQMSASSCKDTISEWGLTKVAIDTNNGVAYQYLKDQQKVRLEDLELKNSIKLCVLLFVLNTVFDASAVHALHQSLVNLYHNGNYLNAIFISICAITLISILVLIFLNIILREDNNTVGSAIYLGRELIESLEKKSHKNN